MFKRKDLQMFDLKLNKYSVSASGGGGSPPTQHHKGGDIPTLLAKKYK